ncbi:MAG: DNA-binding protein WhiA [Coriobacteriia bacterium]|nr:DNA-binding protein WhiA [Coriobacteriia bacterium]
MSFTQEVKSELSRVEPTCSHCERALLAALVRVEGTLGLAGKGAYRLEVSTDVAESAKLVHTLVRKLYGLQTQLSFRRSVLHSTLNYLIEVPNQPGLEGALVDLGVLKPEGGLEMGIRPSITEKLCCASAYVRGAFLGSGFVSNPHGEFHFEMTVENQQLAEDLVALMALKDINGRITQRRNAYVVYLKSGQGITDFLAFAGAHTCALAMEEQRVIKSVRNDVNRSINAEVSNQRKASNAAVDQVFAIRRVLQEYGVDNLPPALQEVCRLRARYPQATLKELGEMANPPLSKSAVYHRIRRIEAMAEQLQE